MIKRAIVALILAILLGYAPRVHLEQALWVYPWQIFQERTIGHALL